MKSTLIKISIFIVSFLLSATVISAVLNIGNTDMTVEMAKASFPIVNMKCNDRYINTLHGFSNSDMKANYLRETLTPLPLDRKLHLKVELLGSEVTGVSYEIRSLDTKRLVEKTDVYDYVSDGESMNCVFGIKDLIEKDKEYILVTILKLGDGRDVYYYTRIVESEAIAYQEMIDFCMDFHEKLFDKNKAKALVTYLESNSEGDNSTYQQVNIHSSFQQVTWGNLNIEGVQNLSTQVLEMDQSMASVMLEYELQVKNTDMDELYMVKEYFRIRYTPDRIYLIDYNRTMDQIFNPENEVFVNDKIILGITGDKTYFHENNDGSTVIFKQGDALYEYKNSEGLLSRIFCFYDEDNIDSRSIYDRHDIKLLNMDETGNVYFMVYGYMNRGRHEGMVGVSFYYYDHSHNSIEEKVFIPYDKSFGLLEKNIEKLSYVNRNQKGYLYLDGTIYCVDLNGSDGKVIVSNVGNENLVVSKSNQLVAYTENNSIYLINLNNGNERQIKAASGEIVTALGFLQEDLVYGIANENNMIRDLTGIVIRPMHTIKIENKSGQLMKEYKKEHIFVTNVQVSDTAIQMKRIRYDENNGNYYSYSDDQIMNNYTDSDTKNHLISVLTEDRETIKEIALLNNVTKSIHMQVPKEVLIEGGRTYVPSEENKDEYYYVYASGALSGVYMKAVEAVNEASKSGGVVVNSNQDYIWQKGNRKQRTELSGITMMNSQENSGITLSKCLDSMLIYAGSPCDTQAMLDRGETALGILRSNIDGEVLELGGCSLQDVLYYVSSGMPVMAKTDNGGNVLIIGYDEKNIIVLDPLADKKYKKGLNDSREWFAASDNEFITYVPISSAPAVS